MKRLKNIFTNPMAITTAIVHWIIFVYALIFEDTGLLSKGNISFPRTDYIYRWLEYLNIVPLTITEMTGNILEKTIGMNVVFHLILAAFVLFLVTFQWLFIGYCFAKLFNPDDQRKMNLSFK